jgi:DNA-binding transcriptional ArsR family regulator
MPPRPREPRDGARELAELDRVMEALAHASRRHVLVVLHARGGEMTSGALAERFSCSWPTTSRHVRILEEAGLVHVARLGRRRMVRLVQTRFDLVRSWLDWFDGPPIVPLEQGRPRRGRQ